MKHSIITGVIALVVILLTVEQAYAQIYELINSEGKTIFITPEVKDKEKFIIEKMKEKGGSGWRFKTTLVKKGCVARRSVTYTNGRPTQWFTATGDTYAEAELNVRNAVAAVTSGGGNHEGTKCNTVDKSLQIFDLLKLEESAGKR